MYYVINWDTNEIIKEFDNLNAAKRFCRSLGHTGEYNKWYTGYPPVARVDGDNGVVYNPRFNYPKKES